MNITKDILELAELSSKYLEMWFKQKNLSDHKNYKDYDRKRSIKGYVWEIAYALTNRLVFNPAKNLEYDNWIDFVLEDWTTVDVKCNDAMHWQIKEDLYKKWIDKYVFYYADRDKKTVECVWELSHWWISECTFVKEWEHHPIFNKPSHFSTYIVYETDLLLSEM